MALLLAKEAGRDGPPLEDLIAALVAQQRRCTTVIRRSRREVSAIARQLLADAGQMTSRPERDAAAGDELPKIAAASKGRLLLRYFTENTPEPIHPPPVDEPAASSRRAGG